MKTAPLHTEFHDGLKNGEARWATCADGVNIRVAIWNRDGNETAVIFQGRTQYIERYAMVVEELVARGFCVVTLDWRGQGLSDRLIEDRLRGHVDQFDDYDLDVDAVLKVVQTENLPKPSLLIGHSMGGGIALRALQNGVQFDKVIFSGPMWGIALSGVWRIIGGAYAKIMSMILAPGTLAPTQDRRQHVFVADFEGNPLTNDKELYHSLETQMTQVPDLEVGGPSINWVHQALQATANIRTRGVPNIPALCLYGTNDSIVSVPAINSIMQKWSNGTLVELENAQHEIFLEEPHIREQIWAEIDEFLASK